MRSEKELERHLVKEVRTAGGECIKLDSIKGIPDRLVLLPGGQATFVELKSPRGTGRVSKIQRYWLRRLQSLGFSAAVVDSREGVKNVIGKQKEQK